MGDPSSLRLVPASSASTPIDWTLVPEASKKILLDGWGYDWDNEVKRPLPATVGDLVKMFDESKFFGYYTPTLLTLLMDISEFGLKTVAGQSTQVGPRFYMKYLEQVWFFLFMPGKRDCISGYSHDVIEKYDDGYDDEEENKRILAEEIKMAQKFDLKLTREVSQGAAEFVGITKKLGGWDASTINQDLAAAQYVEAIQTLPISHPAYQGMMEAVMSSIRGGGGPSVF
jgi:hypothetical protein